MKHLLDSDCVVDALKGVQSATVFVRAALPDGIGISIVTYTEVYEGIYGSRDPLQSERIFRSFLAAATLLPVDRSVGRRTARIRAAPF